MCFSHGNINTETEALSVGPSVRTQVTSPQHIGLYLRQLCTKNIILYKMFVYICDTSYIFLKFLVLNTVFSYYSIVCNFLASTSKKMDTNEKTCYLPALRRRQPITKMCKFLQQPVPTCYNSYMVTNNNTRSPFAGKSNGKQLTSL